MFDIFDPVTLATLINNLVIGIAAAFTFLVAYHITTQNWDIDLKKRDLFFMLAGPAVGILGSILGLPQGEIIMYTFTVNGGLTGAKEGISKYFERKHENDAIQELMDKIAELEGKVDG